MPHDQHCHACCMISTTHLECHPAAVLVPPKHALPWWVLQLQHRCQIPPCTQQWRGRCMA